MRGVVWIGLGVLCGVSAAGHAALQLTPGTLLVSSINNGIIRQIDPLTGATLSSVAAVYQNGMPAEFFDAMTVLDGNVYVADGFQTLRLNHTTGLLAPLFVNVTGGMSSRPGQIIIQGDQFVYWYDTAGVLIDSVMVDNQSAGGADIAERLRDVSWTGTRFNLLFDQQDQSPARFNFFRFNTDGSLAGSSVQFNRGALFQCNGFDVDLATNQYWVAMNRFDGSSSEVRLYQDGNPNALRTLQLPFGGASDIVYIVPTPASAAVLLGAGVFAVRRRR
jgi:hypothetical protein